MWQHVLDASPYLILFLAFFMVRLVRVFTQHQQKMAEIIHRSAADHGEIAALRQEVHDLKNMMLQQALNRDTAHTAVAERLSAN
jgi:hypothetical protein